MIYHKRFSRLTNMKNLWKKYHHIGIVLLYMPIYFLWYFGLQKKEFIYHDVYTAVDAHIPFIDFFIWFYVYWFIFVVVTCLLLFFTSRKEFYRICAALFIGMTICLIIFTIYPTSFSHRPPLQSLEGISGWMVQNIYEADRCVNVFPSIHVYNSIVCAVALWKSKVLPYEKTRKIVGVLSAILITLSTLFIRQHSILDGLAAGVLAIFICVPIYKTKIR